MKKLLLSLLLIATVEIINAQIYVAADATGTNNGSSWTNAYTDLQQAIYNAPTGSKIWVKQGTYTPTINVSGVLPALRLRHFWLKNGVEVYGGFNGTEVEFNERNINTQKAILDGQVDASNKAYHVLNVNATNTARLDGFIVQNGNSTGGGGAGVGNSGGGLYLTGSAQFFNIEFKNNLGYDHGGAVFASGSSSLFVNCRFESNTTTQYDGGALYVTSSSALQLYNCVLYNNTATRFGAALVAVSSTVLMQNNTVINNTGTNAFQASTVSTINIKQSILWGNSGIGIGSGGGNSVNFTECVYQWAAAGDNINADPLLVDIATGDLALTSGSPAVDAIVTNPVNPYYDIAGNRRKIGISMDMGAYEYNSGQAQIIYVDKDASGNNNGISWTDAYNKVSDALNNSTFSQTEEIWIAEGAYTPHASDRTVPFTLPHQSRMYGGFNGTETKRSQRNSKTNVVTLSGDLNGDDNSVIDHTEATRQDNSYHILYASGVKTGIIIDGLTISGANANGSGNQNTASAILMVHTGADYTLSISLSDVIIEKNTAINAAIFQSYPYATQGSTSILNLSKCVVRNNKGSSTLGNMLYVGHRTYNQKVYGTITNSLFYRNTCATGTATIYNKVNNGSGVVTPLTVRNCTFTNNVGNAGKVIHLEGTGDSRYTNNIFYGNGSATPIGWVNSGVIATVFQKCISEDPAFGINQDPLFKNAASDDYSLSCNGDSPAINAGTSSGILSSETDFAGKPRLVSIADIGAFEFQDTLTISTTASSVCPGAGVTLTANGATSVTWDNGITDGLAFFPASTLTYTATGINANGCNDTSSVEIKINQTYNQTETVAICSGASYTFHDGTSQSNITSQVVHTNNLQTVGKGCDSVIVTTVNINPTYNQTETVSICSGAGYTFHDGTSQSNITAQVVHTNNLQTVEGCDSVIVTTVNINPTYNQTETVSICSGAGYTFHDGTSQSNITSQVIHTNNLQTVEGCDSVIVTTVNVNPTYNQTETVTICNGAGYTFHDGTSQSNITAQVVHTNNLQTAGNGCDSVIVTTVNVTIIDITTNVSGNTITANQGGTATYRWLDCNNSNAVIPGETTQNFTVTLSGNYAVEITLNSCTDTSACVNMSTVNIYENAAVSFSLFPNPTQNFVTLQFDHIYNSATVEVMNVIGQEVLTQQINNAITTIQLPDENGFYFIKVTVDGISKTMKVIKK